MHRFPEARAMSPKALAARTFRCREGLWEGLEQASRELECSVDYLVNEAVKQYLRRRAQQSFTGERAIDPGQRLPSTAFAAPPPNLTHPWPTTPSGQYRVPGDDGPPTPPRPLGPPPSLAPHPLPHPLATLGPTQPTPKLPPPPRPSLSLGPPPPPPAFVVPAPRAMPPPLPPPATRPRLAPPPLPPSPGPPLPPPPLPRPPRRLVVIYGTDEVTIDSPSFVLGRASGVGLRIRDPNVSRQHLLVETQGGVAYLVDLGSTNGVKVNGEMVARRPIADGDVADLSGHLVRFTYRE